MAYVITKSRTGSKLRARDMSATRFHLPTEGQFIINDMVRRGVDKRKPKMFAKLHAQVQKMVNNEKHGKPMAIVDYEETGHPIRDLPRDRIGD